MALQPMRPLYNLHAEPDVVVLSAPGPAGSSQVPASSPSRGHSLPPEVAARLAEAVPANTRRASCASLGQGCKSTTSANSPTSASQDGRTGPDGYA